MAPTLLLLVYPKGCHNTTERLKCCNWVCEEKELHRVICNPLKLSHYSKIVVSRHWQKKRELC